MNVDPDRASSPGVAYVISIDRYHDAIHSCKKTRLVETLGVQEPPLSFAEKTNFAKA